MRVLEKNATSEKVSTRKKVSAEPGTKTEGPINKGRKKSQKGWNEKPELSPQEIRARVAEGSSKIQQEKIDLIKKNRKMNDGFLNEDVQAKKEMIKPSEKDSDSEIKEDEQKNIHSDVASNNPNDLATHGKLKKMLSTNGFNFGQKERDVLEKILQD